VISLNSRSLKKTGYFLSSVLILFALNLHSQNAPVTTLASIVYPPEGTTITVPVTVTGFTDIGELSLTLNYDTSVMSFTGSEKNPLLPGFIVNEPYPGRIILSWFAMSGVTLTDNPSGLANLIFTFPTTSTSIQWVTSSINCEYARFDNGNYTILTDDPATDYYVDGMITLLPTYVISGTLKYNNADQTPLNNVYLALMSGTDTVATCSTADGTGAYQFTGVHDGEYTLVTVHNYRVAGSINSTDASQVNNWLSDQVPIEHVRFLAGDVYYNGSGIPNSSNPFINSSDAMKIQQYYVYGLPDEFLDRDPWCYWKAGYSITGNFDPDRLLDMTVEVNGSDLNLNLFAQVTGDFNGSYLPSTEKKDFPALKLTWGETLYIGSDSIFELPVKIVNTITLSAASIIFDYPSELVRVMDVYINNNPGQLDWVANGNELRIGWNSLNPVKLHPFGDLMILKLQTTAHFTTGKMIRFSLDANPLNELADEYGNTVRDACLSIDPVGSIPTGSDDRDFLNELTLENHPNPFTLLTTLDYYLPVDGKVTLTVNTISGVGKEILLNEDQPKGPHRFVFHPCNETPGIFMATLTLETRKDKLTRSIKIVKER
jgi:hypothetical protein